MNDAGPGPDLASFTRLRRADVRSPARQWRPVLAIALAVTAVAALVWWIEARPKPLPLASRIGAGAPVPVVATAATTGNINIILNALGTVTPLATVTLKSQISGRITNIAFQEGQKVKAGELLAEIDARLYEGQLAQAQGQLLRDQALLRIAQLDLERYRKLVAEGWVAQQKLDAQESLVNQYQGTMKADQAVVDTAALNIAYCHITAPISGRIGLRQVDQGNYVQANDTNGIVIITQMQPITVIFTLPEDQLLAVLKRLHSGAAMPVAAYDRSRSTKLATGHLMTIDNHIDTTTGTVKLKAQFDNDDESLYPKQFVNVQLLVDVARGATVMPTAAVQRGAPGTFVYVVTSENTVTVRPVTLGQSEGERVAVTSGLALGDRVVVDGADRLRDGAKINLSARGSAPTPGGDQHQAPRRASP